MKSDKQIKMDVLEECHTQGRQQFTRVGMKMVNRVKRRLDTAYTKILRDEVQRHPSLGKTLL
jgi:hypothetical protein